jgi:hypothetical protein
MKRGAGLGWIRAGTWVLLCFAGVFWGLSYFVGVQRYQSAWTVSEAGASEEARWFFSNFGSVGLGWRAQMAELDSLPPDEVAVTTFRGSPSALGNVHSEGFFSWHWVHYKPTATKMMGATRTGYGDLFVPYWVLFLGCGLVVLWASRWNTGRRDEARG